MGFELKAFSLLVSEFNEKLPSLQGSHRAVIPQELPQPRQHQVLLLQKIMELLSGPAKHDEEKLSHPKLDDEKSRARILSGVMFLTWVIIRNSYSASDPSKSSLFRILTQTIGITEDNKLEHEDACTLVESAMNFLIKHACRSGKTREGIDLNNPFSSIPGLDLQDYLRVGTLYVATTRNEIWERLFSQWQKDVTAVKEQERREKERLMPSSGLFSGWFGTTKKKEDDVEDVEQTKQTTPAYIP